MIRITTAELLSGLWLREDDSAKFRNHINFSSCMNDDSTWDGTVAGYIIFY